MEDFIKYNTFQNKPDFEEFTSILEKEKILFETEDYAINFIADKMNNNFSHEYVVKLKKEDFKLADELQLKLAENQINNIDKSYYLFEYNSDELKKIIKEKDEWNIFDVLLAIKILKDRGIEISENELQEMQTERFKILSEPDKKTSLWVILGYISAFMGGAFGLFIGFHLMNHKRTLPNGDKIFDYSERDRKQGQIIVIISAIMFSLTLILRVLEII